MPFESASNSASMRLIKYPPLLFSPLIRINVIIVLLLMRHRRKLRLSRMSHSSAVRNLLRRGHVNKTVS